MENTTKYVVQRLKEYSRNQIVRDGDDLWEDIGWDSDHDTLEKAENRVRYVETRPLRIIRVDTTFVVMTMMGVPKP